MLPCPGYVANGPNCFSTSQMVFRHDGFLHKGRAQGSTKQGFRSFLQVVVDRRCEIQLYRLTREIRLPRNQSCWVRKNSKRMKKYRLASQSRQSTKGGSLPGSRSRFFRGHGSLFLREVANSPTGEELSPNGNGAGLDAKVSLFLRQEIAHYLSAERSLEPESEGQATNTIPFAVVPDCIPVEQGESFRSVGVEADDGAALSRYATPSLEANRRSGFFDLHGLDLASFDDARDVYGEGCFSRPSLLPAAAGGLSRAVIHDL